MSHAAEQTIQQARAALYAGQFAQALALAQPLADAPQANVSTTALQIMGLALTQLGRLDEAQTPLRRLLEREPDNAAAWVNLASAQQAAGRADEAIASLTRALQLDPNRAPAHFNLGLLFVQQQDWARAEACFARVIVLTPDRPEPYCQRAEALIRLNRCVEAQRVLQDVLVRYPHLALAWSLLGAAHQKLWQIPLALTYYRKAQALTSDPLAQAATLANMAALTKDRDIELALQYARQAVALRPGNPGVQGILASILIDGGRAEEAYEIARLAREHHGGDLFTLALLTRVSSERCDWQMVDEELVALRQAIQDKASRSSGAIAATDTSFVNPFVLLRFPFDLAELQRITENYAATAFPPPQPLAPEIRARYTGKPRPGRLRVGYFSADFHNHATMYLMAGLFEAHDKSRFETIGFCLGHYGDRPDDEMRGRAKRAFDHFIPVNGKTDIEIAQLARDMDMHIAVDLKGFTQGNRMGVFSHRAAPVQMHYIGYPGTLGMPGAIDYQIADRVLVPEESRPFYSEKIIELPDSYQVNDRNRVIDPAVPRRAELGLPENAFVFCCFNNPYKITREVFGLWMRLLQETPDSVLWLLADSDAAVRNLKQAAKDAGMAPERLIFAPRVKLPQHLARHARADLFLDTWPVNAHTTASDALWAGLPVLTRMDETFASRVSASLLTACHLPELITRTPQEYLDKARELANAPDQLKAIRQKLQATKLQVPLFDTERFTRHIEQAYDLAWERFAQGLPPDHITVPPIDGG